MKKPSTDPIKVTYISSPMMVKASNATEFRAIVQELTGMNSDVGYCDYDDIATNGGNQSSVNNNIHGVDSDVSAPHGDVLMPLFDESLVDERLLWSHLLSVSSI